MIGTRLGPYEITAKLGEGGMGVVYQAKDFHLGREVALKVLPEAFTADPERTARFEREAKLLAQLNHPNIAQIYGLETAVDGSRALVMELVDGPNLADRLAQGALPLEESLSIARQIAEALAEAHEKGIVHRDLKPQNVKAAKNGKAKVLDFGLAKALETRPAVSMSRSELDASPTLTTSGTLEGVILGTAPYMSPEQAQGDAIDKRTDIWAFGAVLFEMLTGRRLFSGRTVTEILASVLRQEIPFGELPAGTPPPIRRLLHRCLERAPGNRLHDIADARLMIDDFLAGRYEEWSPELADGSGERARRPVLWLAPVAVALIVGGAGGWLLSRGAAAPAPPVERWTLALPEGLAVSTDDSPQIALSRDGRWQAAVVTGESASSQILLRSGTEFEPRLLPETEGASAPFFSPDGAWIGFFRDDELLKVAVAGGPPSRLAAVGIGSRGGTWSADGYVYFSSGFQTPLSRVSESGGKVEPVTELDGTREERTHRWPEALPGGEEVLFTCDTQVSSEYYDDARIEVVRPATGERRVLIEGASQAHYSTSGHLVFARGGALFAVDFDLRSLEVRGSPTEIVQGVATSVGSGAVQFALAESGAAVWAPGGLSGSYGVVWVDRDGVESRVPIPAAPYGSLALSPDRRELALVGGQGGVSDLWIADLERGSAKRLTFGENVHLPVWTPDGSRIAYGVLSSRASGEVRTNLFLRAADGSGEAQELVWEGIGLAPSDFTPDGRSLIAYRWVPGNPRNDILRLPLAAPDRAHVVIGGPFYKSAATISPDGKWLAWVSNEGGQDGVYVSSFPEGEGRFKVSVRQGVEPRWADDGGALFYRDDAVLYRVAIDTSHGFAAGRPEPWVDRVASGAWANSYGLSRDGSRVLTLRAPEGSGAQRTLYFDLGFSGRLEALDQGGD